MKLVYSFFYKVTIFLVSAIMVVPFLAFFDVISRGEALGFLFISAPFLAVFWAIVSILASRSR